jgi:O-antigen/teichoic acid export membrane protein
VFRPREIIPYVRFGLSSAGSQLLYYIYTNLDYPIVSYYFGAAANGIYALAYWIVLEAVKTIANVVIDVAFPTFARLRDDKPGLKAQFLRFTRLNLIAVLPFVVLIMLIAPEFLHLAYGGGKWSSAQLEQCAEAARVLCLVGLLRALGYIGPPLLDGIGRPALTLRYMACASILVPGMFVVCAEIFGARYGMLSVALGWAIGYPLAFGVLSYLVVKAIDLSLREYVKASAGIIGCALGGLVLGYVASLVTASFGDGVRVAAISAGTLLGTFGLLSTWQKITPRSIAASMK